MADITACMDKTCPVRLTCYRYRCVWSGNGRQSYALFRIKRLSPTEGCPDLLPVMASDFTVDEDEADARNPEVWRH
jgi:hypothetical protein